MIGFAVMAALGMPKQISKIVIVGGLFNFLIDLYIIPRYNIAGAALTTGLGHMIMAIWASVIIYKKIKFSIRLNDQIKIILSSGIMLGAIVILKILVNLPMIAKVIVVAGSSVVLYAIACFAFGIISKEKIKEARKFFGI
jgi:O-antigen/teichoic acid export membrane protein